MSKGHGLDAGALAIHSLSNEIILLQQPLDPNDFWSAEIHDDDATLSGGRLQSSRNFSSAPVGLLLAHPDKPNLFILNHSAAVLWNALKSGIPQHHLPQHLATHFGIPLSQATTDVAQTLEHWSQTLLAPPNATAHASQGLLLSSPPTTDDNPNGTAHASQPLLLPNQTVFHFSLGAQSFRLFTADPAFVAEIQPRLAHLLAAAPTGAQPSAPPHDFHVIQQKQAFTVFSNGTLLGSVADPAQARILLLPEIGRLAAAPQHHPAPEWLAILHAAALAHPVTNHAVLLSAPTGSGKTTLTAALTYTAGLRLLSDDSSAITAGHPQQVLSLPFALMLRPGSWPVLTPYYPEIPNLPIDTRYGISVRYLSPSNTSTKPAVPQYLVFPQYNAAAKSTKCQPVSPLQAFYQLEKSGFWVNHTQAAITEFTCWLQTLPAFQLQYSDLPEALAFIAELLGPTQ